MTAKVLSFANFKGGVGKTSTTALTSYELAKKGYKVLDIDFDAQANLTSLLLQTKSKDKDIITLDKSFMTAINEGLSIDEIKMNIQKNLDLVPNAVDFAMYPRFIDKNFDSEFSKIAFMKNLISQVKEEYDFIFIDVPPTISLQNDTAYFACDQIIIVLQTQARSLDGADIFINYLQDTIVNEFKSMVDVLGILPVLSKRNAAVDREVLRDAKDEYGNNVFDSHIMQMERVKRYDMTGITDNAKDMWDKQVHEIYGQTADEIVKRLEELKQC